jgi:hypothetical protein
LIEVNQAFIETETDTNAHHTPVGNTSLQAKPRQQKKRIKRTNYNIETSTETALLKSTLERESKKKLQSDQHTDRNIFSNLHT